MTDPHPHDLEIEIDRNRLRAYLRAQSLVIWALLFSFLGIICGLSSVAKDLEQGVHTWSSMLTTAATAIGIGWGLGLLVASACYFVFNHRMTGRFADELRISVEGPFLRIRQRLAVATDRKLHFRAIVDYAVVQDPFMRLFDIHSLQMTTTGSGPTSIINVPGVKDCLKARDTLSEIDGLRENTP